MFARIANLVCLLLFAGFARAADKVTFEDHLLPILRNECTSCHNPDKKKGGLDLSTYQSALAGGDSGPVANASDPDSSLLYKAVAQLDDVKMPKGKGKLADKDINVFKQWIAGGLIENAGGKAIASAKPKINLAVVTTASARPTGPIAMPHDLSLEPVVHTKRPAALMCLAGSPWGPLVAVGGRHQVLLYNTASLDLLGVLAYPEGDPYVTAFSRNGSTLLIGGGVSAKSGHVVLFDVATGGRITQVGDEFDAIIAADISPDQSTVAMGGPGKTLKVYATSDGQLLHAIKKHTDWVTATAYSPDGVLLASGDRQGGLFVWEAHSANEFYTLAGHKGGISAVCFRDDSNLLASASEDGSVKLWDMPTGKLVKTWNAHPSGVTSVSFAHDGRIVTCGRDKVVRIWKPDGSALAASAPFPDIALHAVFDADAKRIVAGDWSGAIRVLDALTAKPVGEITANPPAIGERIAAADKDLATAQVAFDKNAAAMNEAARQLSLAKAKMARLKIGQARSELASKQATLLQTQLTAQAAKVAADHASGELKLARDRVSDGPRLIQARENDLAAATDTHLRAVSELSTAKQTLDHVLVLARGLGNVAQQLSDAARGFPQDKNMLAAAAEAKAAFDRINASLDSADLSVASHMHGLELAKAKVSEAADAVAREKAAIEAAPRFIAPLLRVAESTTAEARNKSNEEKQAAQEVNAARVRLDQLASAEQLSAAMPAPATQPVARKN